MPVDRNVIGSRGEGIAINLLTRPHGRTDPFFRPRFLGDKYPAIDLFVELVGAPGNQAPFFFAQVKATRQGYTTSGRLKVPVSRAGMNELVRYPAPTYVIGVDEPTETAFVVAAVVGGAAQYRSLPTDYPLADPGTLQLLFDEVLAFWAVNTVGFATSRLV